MYLHGSITRCIKNIPELGFTFLISQQVQSFHLMLTLKEQYSLTNINSKWPSSYTNFYIVFPRETCKTSCILPGKSALLFKESRREKIKDTFFYSFLSNVTYLECFYWTENLFFSSTVSFLPKFATYTLYHVLPKVCGIWVIIQKCSPLL